MIKLIATIDLLRGIAQVDLPSVAEYQEKKIKNGGLISDPDRFDELIEQADELYITQLCSDLDCKKFFPHFENDFRLAKKSPIKRENGLEYQHQLWRRLARVKHTEE